MDTRRYLSIFECGWRVLTVRLALVRITDYTAASQKYEFEHKYYEHS